MLGFRAPEAAVWLQSASFERASLRSHCSLKTYLSYPEMISDPSTRLRVRCHRQLSLDPSPGHYPVPPGLSAASNVENLNTKKKHTQKKRKFKYKYHPEMKALQGPLTAFPQPTQRGSSYHFLQEVEASQAHMQIRGFVYVVVPCLSTLATSGMPWLVLENCIVPPLNQHLKRVFLTKAFPSCI